MLVLLSTAWAAPGDTYRDWQLELRRATDTAARTALAEAAPDQARVWLYAYLFDLGTPGVPEAEKARITDIATGLVAGLPEPEPAVLLDRGREGSLDAAASATLAAIERAQRVPMDPAVVVALPTVAGDAPTARATIYGLLHRAQQRQRRLGGRRNAETMRRAARRLAGDLLQLTGDLATWRATHADTPPPLGPSLAAGAEHAGLSAWAAGEHTVALQKISEARALLERQRGASLRTTLLRGALAEILLALKRPTEAVEQRHQQVRELSQLAYPWLVSHARVGLARAHLAAGDPASAANEATALGPVAQKTDDPALALQLVALADALSAAGRPQIEAGHIEQGATLLAGADALYKPLLDRGTIERSVPAAQRAEATHDRAVARGEVAVARARAASVRAQLGEALKIAEAAVRVFPEDARAPGLAAVAEHALNLGALDRAAEAATAAEPDLRTTPLEHAQHRLVQGRIRLRQGKRAPAFALANAGLATLRDAGLADAHAPLRARLHRLAALALQASHPAEARQRLAFAQGVQPQVQTALDLAAAHLLNADLPAARAALATFDHDDARVLSGCLAVRAGDPAAALQKLAGRRPSHPRSQIQAHACRVAAYFARGEPQRARRELEASRHVVIAPWVDPADAWPWYAAEAQLTTGDAAATARQTALRLWRASQDLELTLLSDQRPSWLADPSSLITTLPEAGAWQDRQTSVWRTGPDAAAERSALTGLRGQQAAYARAQRARRDAVAQAVSSALQARTQARAARRLADARWATLVDPQPVPAEALQAAAGTARIYYRSGAERGEVVLYRPNAEPQRWSLPGRAALQRGVDAVSAAYTAHGGSGPYERLWDTLAGAAITLAPWANEPSLAGLTLHIWADGPLQAFPFETLVLTRPSSPDAAPEFVATRWPVVHRASQRAANPAGTGQGFARVGTRAADDTAIADALVGAEARLQAKDAAAALNHNYAWLSEALPNETLTGPIQADALLFAAHPPPPSPLVRWAGVRWVISPTGLGPQSPGAAGGLWAQLTGRAPVFTLRYGAGTETTRGVFTAEWLPAVGAEHPLPSALRAWRARAVRNTAFVDGRPAFHPVHWARWRLVQQ
jgi:hypothetical protein